MNAPASAGGRSARRPAAPAPAAPALAARAQASPVLAARRATRRWPWGVAGRARRFAAGLLPLVAAPLLLLSSVPVPVRCAAAEGAGEHPAIEVGETLTFTVRYGVIHAGTAVMAVEGMRRVGGRPAYLVTSTATSNSMFDGIYRVRDRVVSLIDAETLETLVFEKFLREGKYRADQRVRFDQERGVAVYQDGKEHPLERGALDVLAAFYRVRTLPLEVGQTIYLTSHDNRKNYPLKVTMHSRERVETPAGTFDCLVIEPTLRSGAFFKNEGKLTIWLTDDERRMPVLMRSRLPIGAISVELIEYERPGDGEARAGDGRG